MRNIFGSLLIVLAAIALAATFSATESRADRVLKIEPLVWQLNRDYPDGSPPDYTLPINTVYIKTHDGTDWMSTYDSHPLAVSGPGAIQNLIHVYGDQGIDVAAWFVPKGTDFDTQVQMAEQVIDSGVTALYADLEPFAGFCYQDCGALATNFWARVRAERPNARLGVIYDPRPWWWDASGTSTWFASADVAMPMCYWDDFAGQVPFGDPAGCITQARSDLAKLSPNHSMEYLPLLEGDSTADKMQQALDASIRNSAQRVGIWRRGVVSGDVWNMIAAYQAPSGPHCAENLVDGCLVREAMQPQIYYVAAGAKFLIPDLDAFNAMGLNQRDVQILPQGEVASLPDVPPDGTLLQEFGGSTVYVIYGGAKFVVPDGEVPAGSAPPPLVVPPGSMNQIPSIPPAFTLLKEQNSNDRFVILYGGRIQLNDAAQTVLTEMGHPNDTLHVIPDGGLDQIPVLQVKRGDIDCDGTVGIIDALGVLRRSIGISGTGLCMQVVGDVTCDGHALPNDAVNILLYFAEVPVPEIAGCPPVGELVPALLPDTPPNVLDASPVASATSTPSRQPTAALSPSPADTEIAPPSASSSATPSE